MYSSESFNYNIFIKIYVTVSSNICKREKKNCEETGGTCFFDNNLKIDCKCPDRTNYDNIDGCKCKYIFDNILK